MKRLKQCWQKLIAQLARGLLALLGILPLPVLLAVAHVAAWLAFRLWGKRRRIAIENLLQCGVAADAKEAWRMAEASFHAFVLMIIESLLVRQRITAENWREFVTLKLSPEAEKLLADPKQGLIVASAHLGNWEVAARAVSMLKPMMVVYRPFNNPELDRVVHAGRSGENLRLVSRNERSPMRFIQALAQGDILALMIDQHVSDGRVQVDFFGRKAWTTKSVAMLHFTTRAPLLLAVAIRTGPLRYEVHAVGPVNAPRTGDRDRDAFEITQALTRQIEDFARKYPEQYMWGHRRWKPA